MTNMLLKKELCAKRLVLKAPGPVPEILRVIGGLADAAGLRAYLVGGAVRDLMLGEAGNIDIDIAIEGDGIVFARALAAELESKFKAYPRFKTAAVFYKGKTIDIATARSESYPRPAGLPVVRPAGIKEDMFRRDFTINAMAIGINKDNFGVLYDFYGGLNDLRAKRIRVLHDNSFIDDPTRILRAERFAERLGFGIERRTQRLMKEAAAAGMLARLEGYRVAKERKKGI